MQSWDEQKVCEIRDLASKCTTYREISDRLTERGIALSPDRVKNICRYWKIHLAPKDRPPCPHCGQTSRSSWTRNGVKGSSQRFHCLRCDRTFTPNPLPPGRLRKHPERKIRIGDLLGINSR